MSAIRCEHDNDPVHCAECVVDREQSEGILNTPGITAQTPSECSHGEEGLCYDCIMDAVQAVRDQPLTAAVVRGGLRGPTCFCTGECKRNPCHPCNGGIGGRPLLQQGWVCPSCGTAFAPWVRSCDRCAAGVASTSSDCGCPTTGYVCYNAYCPRAVKVTYADG
jgi:hypothetical protein